MQIILNKLNEILKYVKGSNPSRYMNIKEVSEYTNLSIATLHRRISDGSLKVSKTTGKCLFRLEWADKLLGE